MSVTAIHAIRIPLDGSSFSQTAVAYGLYIARRMTIPLIGLHAAASPGSPPAHRALVENFLSECRSSGVSSDLQEIIDLSPTAILNAAVRKEAGLVAVPRPGQADDRSEPDSWLRFPTLGESGALMVIPPTFQEIESMGLIHDGSAEACRSLDLAVSLSRMAAWPLTILLPCEEPSRITDISRQLEDYFELQAGEPPIDWDTVVLDGSEAETVLRFVRDGSIELLTLPFPDLNPFLRRLLHESPIPLVLIR